MVNGFQGIGHRQHQTRSLYKSTKTTTTATFLPSKSSSKSSKSALNVMNFFKEGKKALAKSLAGEYDSVQIRKQINDNIKSNNVIMYSFTSCPYCIKAKSILDENKIKYIAIELDKDNENGKAIRAELGEMIGRTSVPAIWIKQQYIGGCNDGGPNNGGLVQYIEQNKK